MKKYIAISYLPQLVIVTKVYESNNNHCNKTTANKTNVLKHFVNKFFIFNNNSLVVLSIKVILTNLFLPSKCRLLLKCLSNKCFIDRFLCCLGGNDLSILSSNLTSLPNPEIERKNLNISIPPSIERVSYCGCCAIFIVYWRFDGCN